MSGPGTYSTDTFDVVTRAAEFRAARRPFVLATVTVSRRPTSARAGSRAIVTRDGALFGWVGGACSQPAVVRNALEALDSGEPRLIRLSPDGDEPAREGVIELRMTCHSGGTLEIFLEPFLPPPYLVVVGDSPVGEALSRLGSAFDYDVVQVRPDSANSDGLDMTLPDRDRAAFVVVATMGTADEAAIEAALRLGPAYLGVVGSRRRFAALADYLRATGVSEAAIESIHAPAGIDIHAETPSEIALSILAEMVKTRRSVKPRLELVPETERHSSLVVDPICGMTVDLAETRFALTIDGVTYGFCCPACKRQFERERVTG